MWDRILTKFLPFKVYRQIRDDMVDIYVAAYRKLPSAQAKFGSLSNQELRDLAASYAFQSQNYDPAEPINELWSIADGLWTAVKAIAFIVFGIGVVTGGSFWIALSRGLLRTLTEIEGIFVSMVLLGPTALGTIVVAFILFIRAISTSSAIIQTLNRELVIGPGEYSTRDTDRLVGIALWNSSLCGRAAIKLLSVFSTLWLFSLVPRWDPYGYIVTLVKENIDAFEEIGGYRDATIRVYQRIRLRKGDEERMEPEVTIRDDS